MRIFILFSVISIFLAFEPTSFAAPPFDETRLRGHIEHLSSPQFEGRGTGAPGDEKAVAYLIEKMKAMGLNPGGEGGAWSQNVPLVGMKSEAPKQVTVTSGSQSLSLTHLEDFVAFSGNQDPASQLDQAEFVFVGYGIVAPEFHWDDFKGVDVKGKVLLVMNSNPTSFAGKTRLWYGRWDYKYQQAAKMGAAGVVIIHTVPSASYPWQVVQTSWVGERFELPYEGEPRLQVRAWATESASRKIAKLSGKDLDQLRKAAELPGFRPVALGSHVSISLKNQLRSVSSLNAIGKVGGSDPVLKNEGLFFTAHHDHLGKKGDKIYPGALDNASGVAAVLELAKAFAELKEPPKRSLYFVFTTAEEQGLLGSEYFVKHPVIAPGRMAANFNLDGINFYGKTRDLGVIGLGKSSLDQVFERVAKERGRVLTSDLSPEMGAFYRSDQFNFAKVGVPAVFFDLGLEVIGKPEGYGKKIQDAYIAQDYHQPSDVMKPSWDFSGAVEDLQFILEAALSVANASQMPTWNKGDEFEAARLKALSTSR